MDAAALKDYRESISIVFGSATPEGEVKEEIAKIFYAPIDGDMVTALVEIERDTAHEVPIVTRQLQALKIWSRDITTAGKPLTHTVESISELKLPVQQRIVSEICAPVIHRLLRAQETLPQPRPPAVVSEEPEAVLDLPPVQDESARAEA